MVNETIDGKEFCNFDYLEFVEYCRDTERLGSNGKSSEEGSKSFTESDSYEEAEKFAIYGWDKGLELIKDLDQIVVSGGVMIQSNVHGATVDVPRYLSGLPDHMNEFVDLEDRAKPNLTLLMNLSYNCGYSAKDAVKYCIEIIELVNKLQSRFNLQIVGLFGTRTSLTSFCAVTLKTYDEPVVLNSLVYAFHPAFFRRIWFKFLETKPYWEGGYGSSVGSDSTKGIYDELKEWRKKRGFDDDVFLPTLGDFLDNKDNWERLIVNKEVIEKQLAAVNQEIEEQ